MLHNSKLVGLGLFAFTASSCTAGEQAIIPQTSMPLEELVFASGQDVVWRPPAGSHTLCVESHTGLKYNTVSIYYWAGHNYDNVVDFREQLETPCKYGRYPLSTYEWEKGDISTEDCIIRMKIVGIAIESASVFPRSRNADTYYQCDYRLAMIFSGFTGAATMSEAKLFAYSDNPTTEYGGLSELEFRNVVPVPFVRLQQFCGRPWGSPYRPAAGKTRAEINDEFLSGQCKVARN